MERLARRTLDAAVGTGVTGLLRLARRFSRKNSADRAGALLRRLGPYLPEHRVGRQNLRMAFPEKSDDEIELVLAGVWDNLGRFAADFAHLDRIQVDEPTLPGSGDIEYSPEALARFEQLRASQQPAILFAAHLANWELPALVAHRYGVDAAVLYRRPNVGAVADAAIAIRAGAMGTLVPTTRFAAIELGRALQSGRHVGMLVDQYYTRGVPIMFFGQPTRANPLLARLANQFDCAIHGTRIVRLPGNRFRGELTPPIIPPKTANGKLDIAGTMQVVHDVIEGWIREYPDQWLWIHRRWRPNDKSALTKREAAARRQVAPTP